MYDSDMEFIVPEEIGLTDNAGNGNVLTPEANVHVVDEVTTHTKELETNKNRKNPEENNPDHMEKQRFSTFSRKLYCWERCFNQFDKSISTFDIYEQVINLDVLIELLVQQSNLHSQQNGRTFLANVEEMKAFIGVNYIMAANRLQSRPMYSDFNHFVGKIDIQNIFTMTRCQ